MQLDRTEISIRARSALELLDLSLLVLRKHFASIVLTSALIGVPLLAFDVLVVAWMLGEDTLLMVEDLDYPVSAMRWRHSTHLIFLFVTQFQLISLPTTIFLGNRIFYEPMPIRKLLSRLLPIALRCLLVLGVVRLGLVSIAAEFFVDRTIAFDWLSEFWLIFAVGSVAILLRAAWPFAPEILGLELCPLRSKKASDITYSARSRSLHSLLMSDHIARFIGAAAFGALLFAMLIAAQLFVIGVSTGSWQWNAWFDHAGLMLSLWCVGLFMSVFRFLSYLDSRIRLEGWEIELRLKAEAQRLQQSSKVTSGSLDVAPEQVVA